jgi:hypothetical protein
MRFPFSVDVARTRSRVMWGYIGSARQDTTMTTTTIGTKIVCRITIWLQETSEKAATFFAIAFAYYNRAALIWVLLCYQQGHTVSKGRSAHTGRLPPLA